MKNDQELLHEYGHTRSEKAFAEIVRRYIDLVYSAKVTIRNALLASESQERNVAFSYERTTDNAGRFTFEMVPAGRHRISRFFVLFQGLPSRAGESHGTDVVVKAGETEFIRMGGEGRTIVGQMIAPSHKVWVDWTINLQKLADHRNLPGQERNEYFLKFKKDGTFTVDDVPPGQYVLKINVTEPLTDPSDKNRFLGEGRSIGTFEMDVIVPQNTDGVDHPLNLGVLKLNPR